MRRGAVALAVLAGLLSCASPASAHSLRFGVLRIVEAGGGAEVRLTARGAEGLAPDLGLEASGGCAFDGPVARRIDGDRLIASGTLACDALEGARVEVTGLAESEVSLAVEVVAADGAARLSFLDPPATSVALGEVAAPTEGAFRRYLRLGAEHIATGIDHLAFVLLLLLAALDRRGPVPGRARRAGRRGLAVLGAVTGFTLGHSVTLSLAVLLGWSLPSAPVEACIALSIVVLAAELAREGEASLTLTRPWTIAAAFGLVHGLGFAGALGEVGVPDDARVVALLAFNLGVELGQLAFVLALVAAAAALARLRVTPRARWVAYATGVVATAWTVARLDAMF